MPRIKSDKVVIWAAVNPDGQIVISSISAYYSVAYRWAMKYRNHEVRKVDEIERYVDDAAPTRAEIRAELRSTAHSEPADPQHDEIKVPKTNGNNTVLPPVRKRYGRNARKAAQ